MKRRPFPLYPCGHCGARRGYRLGIGGPWRCGGCRPAWTLAAANESTTVDNNGAEEPAGIRPALAYADAPIVAELNAIECASAQRFLRAVAAGRGYPEPTRYKRGLQFFIQ